MAAPGVTVNVAVRVRPLMRNESEQGARDVLRVDNIENQVTVKDGKTLAFDKTMPQGTSQAEVYEHTAKPLVDTFFKGCNATVMAYGQTGSGKTYTMGSGFEETEGGSPAPDAEHKGVIRRVMEEVFERVKAISEETDCTVRLSFLEIYNEQIHDLLVEPSVGGGDRPTLRLHEAKHNIEVQGLTEKIVENPAQMEQFMQAGSRGRHTAGTKMNEHSSRSHAICTISLAQRPRVREGVSDEEAELQKVVSKFHLVDLAGSERAKRTGAEGERFKEGVNINSSLLVLGNVISALGDEEKVAAGAHVPYRESKLTRLLQDSLGGNSRTVLIGCVSPADINLEETFNCLTYVHRARNIKNVPVVNRDPRAARLLEYKQQIQTLQRQLLENGITPSVGGVMDPSIDRACTGNSSGTYQWEQQHAEEANKLNRTITSLKRQNLELLKEIDVQENAATAARKEAVDMSAQCDRWRDAFERAQRGETVEVPADGMSAPTASGVLEDQLRRIAQLESELDAARNGGYVDSGEDALCDGVNSMDVDTEDADLACANSDVEDDEEVEKNMAEQAAAQEGFERKQAAAENQLKEIENELAEREIMMRKITEAAVDKEHQQRLNAMREVHTKREQKMQEELDQVKKELAALQKESNKSQSQMKKMRELREREKKVKQDMKTVQVEKRRLQLLERQQARKDAEMARQQHIIDDLKHQKTQVRRRMEREADENRKRQRLLDRQMARVRREKERKEALLAKREKEHSLKMSAMQQKLDHEKRVRSNALAKDAAYRRHATARSGRGAGLQKMQLRQIEQEIEHNVTKSAKAEEIDALIARRDKIIKELAHARTRSGAAPGSETERTQELANQMATLDRRLAQEQKHLADQSDFGGRFSVPPRAHDAKRIAETLCNRIVTEKLSCLGLKRQLSEMESEIEQMRTQMRQAQRRQFDADQRASVLQQQQNELATKILDEATAPPQPAQSYSAAPPPPPPGVPPGAPTITMSQPPTVRTKSGSSHTSADEEVAACDAFSAATNKGDDLFDDGMEDDNDNEQCGRKQSLYACHTVSSRNAMRAKAEDKDKRGTKRKVPASSVAGAAGADSCGSAASNVPLQAISENERIGGLTPNKARQRDERGRLALLKVRQQRQQQRQELQRLENEGAANGGRTGLRQPGAFSSR